MNQKLREQLEYELETQIACLPSIQQGSEEHVNACKSIDTLSKMLAEDDKLSVQREMSIDECNRKYDEMNVVDTREKKKDKRENIRGIVKLGLDAAAIAVPAIIYTTWMKRGFEYEQTGSYTSGTFKNLIGKLKPTK